MPERMTIVPAKFKPEGMSEAEFTAIKRGGEKTLAAITALEAVKNSKGAYQIKSKERHVTAQAMDLEDMDNNRLKVMAVSLGVRFQKKNMTRKQLIALVRRKLDDSVTIVDDEAEVETE